MPLNIEGLACCGSFGFGAQALRAALTSPPPAEADPKVDTSGLSRYLPARLLRQCDRFSRLALLGACMAAEDAGLELPGRDCGIVLASGYGPTTPTFDFLDSVLDFGERMASPIAFSHSVHNIPAAVVAKNLQIVGPCSTVCQFDSAVAAALLLAQNWLDEGRVERVLFGAVEEYTEVLSTATQRLISERPAPSGPSRRKRPLSEGAVFFCLSRSGGRSVGSIASVHLEHLPGNEPPLPDALPQPEILFLSGAVPPASRAHHLAPAALDGSAAYGNLPIAQAFDCVAALSLLAEQPGARALCLNYGHGMRASVTLRGPEA